MAQIDTTLYKSIADAYALIDTNLSTVSANAQTAVDAVVDVTTANYPSDAPSGGLRADALEIELALLSPFSTAYTSAQTISNSVSSLIDAIRAVNNHVVNNTSGTSTAKVKLDNWINTTMDNVWTASCPQGWANLCSDAGYDVTDWTTT